MTNIFAISPLDGRYASKLTTLAPLVSEFGLIKYRVMVEIKWLQFLFRHPQFGLPSLTSIELALLEQIWQQFSAQDAARVKQLEATTNHDVKAVEYLIKEKIAVSPLLHQYREWVHFACTSEDINNISYALMLKTSLHQLVLPQLEQLQQQLTNLANDYRHIAIMSRTHGQPATPSTMGKEIYNVVYRLQRQLKTLHQQQFLAKINGAVGNYNAHVIAFPEIAWDQLAEQFITQELGLTFNPYTTQIEPHDYQAELYDNLRRISTLLIDLARDIWGYIALNYFTQKVKPGEVGSSTMPHKVNPIDFENAEGNFGLANALFSHLAEKLPISRWQRDLTDSTVQRNIGVALGYFQLGVSSLTNGLTKLELNQAIIAADLAANWELLAEPIQTVMRKYGITNAYEQLKELTRGKKIDAATLHQFIASLDLPEDEKLRLSSLRPETYLGLATSLY